MRIVKPYATKNDLFIRARYARELETQIQECLDASHKTAWIPGGHIAAALVGPYLHKKLIVDIVQELENATAPR